MKLRKICANSMGPARIFIPSVLLMKALKIKWSESTKLMHICGVENLSGAGKKDNRQNNNEISKNLCQFCAAGTNVHF